MDQNPGEFSFKKEKLFKELLELMIKALESGTIDTPESEKASRFILDVVGKAEDLIELKTYVQELCLYWDCFKPVLLTFESESAKEEAIEKIEATKEELNKLIDSN